MVRSGRALAGAVIALGAMAGGASAQVTVRSDDPAFLSLGVGVFDFYHDAPAAAEFRGEYRAETKLLGFLKPIGGAIVTSDGAAYGYGGFMTDLYFGNRWVLSPTAAVGLFERGNGKALGSWVEFKTGFEFAYRFDDRSRLGVYFHHISNAGLTTRNPGEESIGLMYSIPFNLLK